MKKQTFLLIALASGVNLYAMESEKKEVAVQTAATEEVDAKGDESLVRTFQAATLSTDADAKEEDSVKKKDKKSQTDEEESEVKKEDVKEDIKK